MTTPFKNAVTRGAATTSVTNNVLNLWSPSDALPFIYGQLKTSIMYMRYLNISRTNELEELYQLYVDSDQNVIPFISLKESIKEAFPQEALPFVFQRYSLPSSFIANFGDDLLGLVIIFASSLITKLAFFLMKRYIRNLPTVRVILHRVHVFLQNFFIGSFAESLVPFTRPWNSETQTQKNNTISSALSCAHFFSFSGSPLSYSAAGYFINST